jgi:hypothetical protein
MTPDRIVELRHRASTLHRKLLELYEEAMGHGIDEEPMSPEEHREWRERVEAEDPDHPSVLNLGYTAFRATTRLAEIVEELAHEMEKERS